MRFKVNEKTDDELAAEKVGGELIAVLTAEEWNDVNVESAHCALLEIAERSGADGVKLWLAQAAIRRRNRESHFRAHRAALRR